MHYARGRSLIFQALFTLIMVVVAVDAHSAPAPVPLKPDTPRNIDETGNRAHISGSQTSGRVEGAVIRPYRQAAVSAETQGVIEKRYCKEGDFVQSGAVVFDISAELIEMNANRSRERLAALQASHAQLQDELRLREQLIAHDAATLQEISRARSEAEISLHRMKEAGIELDLILRDAAKCRVKAPFSGFIVTLFRDAYESIQRFEQLFLIADVSKVYAVVNVPQMMARQLTRGTKAVFTASSGSTFDGVVEKIEAPIDPASQTKKIYILIDNGESKLELGILGHVTFL
jgi:RND family efflux transporter MFP subunit